MNQFFYILMTICGAEVKTAKKLVEEGYAAYCPTFSVKKKLRHRKSAHLAEVDVPVIDGYVFVELSSVEVIERLRMFAGVLKVVSFGGKPALLKIDDLEYLIELAEDLRNSAEIIFNQSLGPQRPVDLKIGERIRIFWAGMRLEGIYAGNEYIELMANGNGVRIKLREAYVERLA